MDPVVAIDLNQLDSFRCSSGNRRSERAGVAGEREHAAVVVRVGVNVEQPALEGRADLFDRGSVTALGDIGHREQYGSGGGPGHQPGSYGGETCTPAPSRAGGPDICVRMSA